MNLALANVCLSGGAEGADEQFGMCAGARGDTVYHFTFEGHRKIRVPMSERVVLTRRQLQEADSHLERANLTLGRALPFHKAWIINLLRRNYFQIKDTQSVYAVTHFKDGKVDGGTAWAVQMFIDRHPPGTPLPLYVFDQFVERWFVWNGTRFEEMDAPPPEPSGVWTGIGARALKQAGKLEIRRLLRYVALLPETGENDGGDNAQLTLL